MDRHSKDHDHGGSSIPKPRNKSNILWQELKSELNDFTCRLGYKFISLPKEAALFILLCSIFPDDFKIPIEELVTYGMSLQLFEDVDDMFAARSRVHDIISIINGLQYYRMVNGKFKLALVKQLPHEHVKMLVGARDLAKSIASWCPIVFRREIVIKKWLKSNFYEDCYGLSLVLEKVNEHPVNLECPKLVLLQLQCDKDSPSIPTDFFGGMKELRVLSLDLPSLSLSLNGLQNLKTLRLKVHKLEDMSWIGGLTTLEFLSICVLSLTDVPRETGQLKNLRSLDLRKMNIAFFPPRILSRLLKLEALYMPLSFRRWGCKAEKDNDFDEWELGEENNFDESDRISANISEIDGGERINATLTEVMSLSLKALQISLPKASVLPKKSPLFKNLREFKILMSDNVRYQVSGKDSVNELQLIGEASDLKERGVFYLMGKTEDLSLIRVKSLMNVLFQLQDDDFAQLKRIFISECDDLEHIFDATGMQILSQSDHLFRKLDCLHLSMLSRLNEIFHGKWKYFRWLPNLSEISIRFCHKLKYVFPLSVVKGSKIKNIEILGCNEMEGIFYEDKEDDFLCSIEKLELHSLPRLTSLLVSKDDMINRVHYDDNESSTTNKVSLIKTDTINDTEIDCAFPSKLAKKWCQNLKRFRIAFCDVKVIFWFKKNHATSRPFNSLEELELHGLQNLVHVWFQVPPKISAFQNLRLLVLSECRNLYLFSPQVAVLMVQLQKVYISRCERMEEVVSKGKEIEGEVKTPVFFPQLKLLELQRMPNLKFFCGGIHNLNLPLMESLKLNQCNKMKCFSNGELRTPLLERIEINGSLWTLTGDLNATMRRHEANQKGQLFIDDLKIDELLGRSEFSAVYKGWIYQTFTPSRSGSDIMVAIKRFNLKIQQQSMEWPLQVKFLESLSHPNLVKLLGHCCEGAILLLMYEFIEKKSLDCYLFEGLGISTIILSWSLRINIAIGVVRGLNYLHTSEKKAIHGDMKSSNILIDANYNANLKDYGLAILWGLSGKKTHRRIMDSYGYVAPESFATGYFDAKSDVYGFGVVLLELMTGLRAFDIMRPNGQQNLVDWLKPILLQETLIKNIMDGRLEGGYSTEAMLLAAKLALKCVEYDAENRPSMKEVMDALEQIDAINKKPQHFIADPEIATRNLRRDRLVGKSEFSAVYKVWVDQKMCAPSIPCSDTAVFIKKLNLKIQQHPKEWQLQVEFLESLSHPNLVKLFGHCCEDINLFLVYEFMARKSLDGYLFGGISTIILSWNMRINIAIGAARGLDFLHTLEKKAIHGDVQTSNILLDANYNAKLKNYGLAILRGPSDKNTRGRVMDIYGYAAPESLATGNFDTKTDVYGFGVVMLELMTGLRAFDIMRPNGQQNLVHWLKPILLQKRIKSLMDERIEGEYSTEAMLLAAKLALKCVEYNAESRPSMKEVVEALEQIDAINENHWGFSNSSTTKTCKKLMEEKSYALSGEW